MFEAKRNARRETIERSEINAGELWQRNISGFSGRSIRPTRLDPDPVIPSS